MANDLGVFLLGKFDEKQVAGILKSYSTLLEKMCSEQKERLSPGQYKLAKNRILVRIAFYHSILKYSSDAQALEYAKEYFYPKTEGARKMMNRLGRSELGCTLFQKAFARGLKADTWVSEIKQNDKKALIYDVTKCLYKDLCDFYECPYLCMLFCDGDWLMFGEMEKLKFERAYTLGQGDAVCDFKFTRRSVND